MESGGIPDPAEQEEEVSSVPEMPDFALQPSVPETQPPRRFANGISQADFRAAAPALATPPARWEWMEEGYLLRRNEPWPPGAKCASELTMELHAVYSVAFQVPTLLFRVFGLDGSSLGAVEVLHALPHMKVPEDSPPGTYTITQCEHPLLGTPFLMLHPCQTDQAMAMLSEAGAPQGASLAADARPGEQYLKTWLSLVESTLGVHSSLQLW